MAAVEFQGRRMIMDVRIKAGPLIGTAYVPPSKSYAHRMLICAALAEGNSTVKAINKSDDVMATLACIEALGAQAELVPLDQEAAQKAVREHMKTKGLPAVGALVGLKDLVNAKVTGAACGARLAESGCGTERAGDAEAAEGAEGAGGDEAAEGAEGAGTAAACSGAELPVYPCNESGSTLRFFIPLALVLTGGGVFTCTPRLIERGISVYEEIFADKDISIETGEDSITVRGKLEAGHYQVRGDISSQFVTGLLFALPLLENGSIIELIPPVESRPYIDITIDALKEFGINILEFRENAFRIEGGQKYTPCDIRVEGDWSAAAFLFAFNEGGSSLSVQGLKETTRQGDHLGKDYLWALRDAGAKVDLSSCPDLGPVLFAVAALRCGGRFTGIRRLRLKESDRVAAMAEEMAKIGVDMEILDENNAFVYPSRLHTPSEPLSGHNDHRVVMALAVLLSVTGGVIEGAEAVNKSWPGFFEEMEELGLQVEYLD